MLKKIMILLLCLSLPISFCGCGKENPSEASAVFTAETKTEAETPVSAAAEMSLIDSEPASYQAVNLPLPDRMDGAGDIWVRDDTLYLCGSSLSDDSVAGCVFLSDVACETDQGLFFLPDGYMTDIQLRKDGSIWVMATLSGEDRSYQGTRFTLLSMPDNVEREFMMDKESYPERPYWLLLDEDRETLYVFDPTTMYALDYDGNELFRLSNTMSMGGTFFDPCFTADGRVAVRERGGAGDVILLLDQATQSWSSVELPVAGWGIYDGELYDLYVRDRQTLYGLDLQAGEMTPILRFLDAGMSGDVWDVCALGGGQFIMLANTQLYFVSPANDS